jgi:hypothetical protein
MPCIIAYKLSLKMLTLFIKLNKNIKNLFIDSFT